MRCYPDSSGNLILGDGDYGQKDGVWYVRPPGQHMGSIPHHVVTEHEDKTVTVMPSIMLRDGDGEEIWHGRLIKGEFTECGKKTEGGEG